jgi:alpha-D-xyloside xylohydrolase
MSGDQSTRFSNLALVIMAGLSSTLSVLPYWSDDVGGFLGLPNTPDATICNESPGFGGKPSPTLYVRWAQFGLFSPLSRCHGTTPREPWEYGEEALRIFRMYAKLRYRLIPYIYSYAHVTSQTGISIVRPMILEFQDDPNCYDKNLQYMFGEELLVAPIFDETNKRSIYLPRGKWIDYWNGEEHEGPESVDYEASLDTLPIFLKADSIIPMGSETNHIGEKTWDPLTLDIYVNSEASFILYEDEQVTTFECRRDTDRSKKILLKISESHRTYLVKLNKTGPPNRVSVGNMELQAYDTFVEFEGAKEGWLYDPSGRLIIKIEAEGKTDMAIEF